MEFVAIDFETANGNANSACQLALVQVQNFKIVQEQSWLIRPPRMYFAPRNVAVHGIRPHQVADAPTMEQIWAAASECLDGAVVIAHNARFDVNVLVASLAAHDVACPNFEFSCTRSLARAGWPGRSRYGLKPLGDSLGIRFRHHDALEDARCCANIALAIAKDHAASSLEELESRLKVKRGAFRDGTITSPRAIGRRQRDPRASSRQHADQWGFPVSRALQRTGSLNPLSVRAAAADSEPLKSKRIVMLGPLGGLSLEDTLQLIQDLGGICQSRISSTTDYVVACGTTLENASTLVCQQLANQDDGDGSGDPARNASGIRLLSERQFRALLPGGKAASW